MIEGHNNWAPLVLDMYHMVLEHISKAEVNWIEERSVLNGQVISEECTYTTCEKECYAIKSHCYGRETFNDHNNEPLLIPRRRISCNVCCSCGSEFGFTLEHIRDDGTYGYLQKHYDDLHEMVAYVNNNWETLEKLNVYSVANDIMEKKDKEIEEASKVEGLIECVII